MLPSAVESKIEQYFQNNRCAPARRSQSSAARVSATALATGFRRRLQHRTGGSKSRRRARGHDCKFARRRLDRPARNRRVAVVPPQGVATRGHGAGKIRRDRDAADDHRASRQLWRNARGAEKHVFDLRCVQHDHDRRVQPGSLIGNVAG